MKFPCTEQAGRLWGECSLQRYDFERPWNNAAKVQRITQQQLLQFFDTYVADGSPTRKRLSTHVFSQRMAPAELTVQQLKVDDFYAPPADMMRPQVTV